jgi:Flp pilus assembly pilin Flp
MLRKIGQNCSGAASAEYVLIQAVVGAGIAAAAYSLGSAEADALRFAAN